LPEVDSLPIPEVRWPDLPSRAVSQDTKRIPLADASTLASLVKPHQNDKNSLAIRLPIVDIKHVHSALYLRYTCSGPVDVLPYFWDPDSRRYEKGKRCRATNTDGKERIFEIPLPDFGSTQTTIVWKKSQRILQFTAAYMLQDQADEDPFIRILSRKANSVDLELSNLSGFRILTFVDAAYPGWKAYVDSKPVPIYLANDVFKAVLIPSGTHYVRFVFRPWKVYLGVAISLITVLGIVAVLIGARRAAAFGSDSVDEPGEYGTP